MKIKGMLFILFAACVGHIGAMEHDKKAGQKPQGMQQGTNVPSLTQQALIAAAKKLVQEIHSENPQDIKKYITGKTNLPTDLHVPLLVEIGRQYYIKHGIELNIKVPWGFSIQDYLTIPALKSKIQIRTVSGKIALDLSNMKINNLQGLKKIPNIGTLQILSLENNPLTTIQPNAFAGLTNLDVLFLENNQLTIIPTNAFAGLTNLDYLYLDHNQLTTISTNAFAGLTKLKYLYIGNNRLTAQAQKAIKKALPGVKIDF